MILVIVFLIFSFYNSSTKTSYILSLLNCPQSQHLRGFIPRGSPPAENDWNETFRWTSS